MIKLILPILFIFLIFAMPASAANEPQNLTAVPFATYVELQWDDVGGASHYSIYRYLPSMLWTDEIIVLDGIIDAEYLEDGANKAVAFSPNPPYDNAYDTFYILRNGTYVFLAASTFDNDFLEDDTASVYIDFDNDGLTNNVDLQFEIQEDGDVVKRKWVSGSWASQPTTATGAVSDAGTSTPMYEMFIPISELSSIENETFYHILIERSDSHTSPTIYQYQPRTALPTSTDGWAPLNITTVENQTFFSYFNVTESEATITGLDPFDLFYFGVSATISDVEYPQSTVSFVTLNTATFNVSGCIHDAETLLPVANAEVVLTDSFVTAIDITDVNGVYGFSGVIADDYTITAIKHGYDDEVLVTVVIDEDITQHDIFMDKSIQDEIPLWLFVVFVLINIGAIVVAFHNDEETGIFSIFCSFIATILAYLNSKILINGYLVESFEFASTIQNAAYSALFHYIAIVMVIITMIKVVMYVHERYQEEEV